MGRRLIYHKLFHLTPDTPFSQLMQAMVDYFRSLDIDEDETDNPDYDHKPFHGTWERL